MYAMGWRMEGSRRQILFYGREEKKKKENYFPKGFFSKERPIAKGEEDYDGKGIDYKTR